MRLNFWQWLGLICVLLGLAGYFFFRTQDTTGPSSVQIAPSVDDDLADEAETDPEADPATGATTQPGDPAPATP